jgi:hypothetical protein
MQALGINTGIVGGQKARADVFKMRRARCSWLMSVILTTQEAEIRRIKVPREGNSSQDPILKMLITKQGWWNGSSGRVPAQQALGPQFKPQ